MRGGILLICALLSAVAVAQDERESGPAERKAGTAWFGVHLPPEQRDPAVVVGDRLPRAISLPAGEPANPEFTGTTIRKDLETIVDFSKQSRATREVGSGQLWGRISGLSSSDKAVEWATDQLRQAGIADTKLQSFKQEPNATIWLPQSWEVRILGDAGFGAGTSDVVLQSAMPLAGSLIANGELTAPLVYVGTANPSLLQHLDVKGKIAVQLVVPQGHMVFERGSVVPRAQELAKRGAVAVLNLVRLPGNEPSFDFNNCGGPCFNIGGRDGLFLESVLDKAAQANLQDKVRARLSLKSERRGGLQAQNGVAVIPGKSDSVIILDAHADAWFDGAGDNADGLAVMLALARHFAKPAHKPDRTLVFIVSAGHHTSGLNGPRNFMRLNPELAKRAVLAINIEHIAQRNFSAGRSVGPDGYRHAIADLGEAPITAGVSNGSPFLDDVIQRGAQRYGVNFVSQKSTMQSGETGGFTDVKGARITLMQAPPLYHTTGETLDVISTPGLERMARFLAFFVKEVGKAPAAKINP